MPDRSERIGSVWLGGHGIDDIFTLDRHRPAIFDRFLIQLERGVEYDRIIDNTEHTNVTIAIPYCVAVLERQVVTLGEVFYDDIFAGMGFDNVALVFRLRNDRK
jgi:hypothetical protein